MKRRILTLLLAGLAAAGAARAKPAPIEVVTLENRLRVLLAPDSLAAAVDVSLWYGAGTRVEPAGRSGLTHLMERLMFRGSPRFPAGEHQRLVQAEGGSVNTFTTPDVSCFFEVVPAEALELALRLEADRLGRIAITEEALAREARIVREGQGRLLRANPIARGLRRLYAIAFPDHAYGWPVSGLEQDLDRVTVAALEAYQRERYTAANAVLAIVGRFDPGEAKRLARLHFGPLAAREVPASKAAPPPEPKAERRAAERIDGEVAVLLVGWRAPGGADRMRPALELLSRLLTAGAASRLQQALLGTPPACLAVEGGFDARRDASLLYAAAALRPGVDSAAVERTVLAECERLATEPVGGHELERVKREAELSTLLGWETVHGRAQALGEALAVYGDAGAAASRLEVLREVTAEQVQRAAAAVLRAERRSVVWLSPGAPRDGSGVAR